MRNRFTLITCFVLLCSVLLNAQDHVAAPDVNPGVITVRKPTVRPYFKVEYFLTAARVTEVEILVPAASGIPGVMERDKVPVFDSSISSKNERIPPQKLVHLSRMFAEEISFYYPFGDTASIDTLPVELWIGTNGKIKWRSPDTAYNGNMPRTLELELTRMVNKMTEWGKGGGYMTPKKFLQRRKMVPSGYYCVMYIITSAKPLTPEQKNTGTRYTLFDIPLNSAPDNAEHKEYLEKTYHMDPAMSENRRR